MLGAIREHPAISAVGSDVIMSGLSLGIWASVRGLDPWQMLGSSMVFMNRVEKKAEGMVMEVGAIQKYATGVLLSGMLINHLKQN